MNKFSKFSNTNNCKRITERSHNYNVFGHGKGKQGLLGLKRTFQNIIHQQANDNHISVSEKTTQENPEKNYRNLNGLLNFMADFLLLFNFQ